MLGPGHYAFWKTPHTVQFAVYDITEFRFEHPRLQAILQHAEATRWLDGVFVDAHEQVLLYRDGTLVETLRQGLFVYWRGNGKVTWKTVDLREQVADVAGQEIMTADKVTLRLNALVSYRITDALRSVLEVDGAEQALYRAAQLALREAVGAKELDALLQAKDALGGELAERIAPRANELGLTLVSAGVKDIAWKPGDSSTFYALMTCSGAAGGAGAGG